MRRQRKKWNWAPPKEWWTYFDASSDDVFRIRHPIGYGLLVLLAILALVLPGVAFCLLIGSNSGWVFLGAVGGFVFGVGLFNYVAKVIGQFLGHGLSAVSFLTGGLMMVISWILCR